MPPGTPELFTLRAWVLPSPCPQSLTQRKACRSTGSDLSGVVGMIWECAMVPREGRMLLVRGHMGHQAAWDRAVQGTP